jgi:hypothetical protein
MNVQKKQMNRKVMTYNFKQDVGVMRHSKMVK